MIMFIYSIHLLPIYVYLYTYAYMYMHILRIGYRLPIEMLVALSRVSTLATCSRLYCWWQIVLAIGKP